MRSLSFVIIMCGLFTITARALPQPLPGNDATSDLGGTMLPGRATRSWQSPRPEIWHAASWDGVPLGTQWRFRCAGSTSVKVLEDSRDKLGNGTFVLELTLSGGTIFLSGAGPWSGGMGDMTGNLIIATIVQTQEWEFWSRISAHDDVVAQSTIDGTPCSVVLQVNNAVQTSTELALPDYPEFLHDDCVNLRSFGQSMDYPGEITLSIDCSVSVETHAWAAIKHPYR